MDEPFLGVQSYDFILIMQREDAQASASAAQASEQNRKLQEVLQEFTISGYSEAQLNAFIDSVTGIKKPHFHKFLLYVLRFVEYNSSKYERHKKELGRIKEELASMKDNLRTVMVSRQEPSPRLAAVLATIPPLASQATALPLASQATAPPLAFQATVLPSASQAMASGQVVGRTTYSPPVLNANRNHFSQNGSSRQQRHSYLFW